MFRLGILRMVLGIPAICGLAAGYIVGRIDQRHPVLTAGLAGVLCLGAVLATPNRGCIQGQIRSIAAVGVGVAAFAGVLGAVWGARTVHPWWGAGAILGAIVLFFVIPHMIRITRVRSFTRERLADVRATVARRLVGIPATDVSWRHAAMPGPRGALGMHAQWTARTEVAGQGECHADIDTSRMPRTGPLDDAVHSVTLFFEPKSPADIQSQDEALSLLEELAVISPSRELEETPPGSSGGTRLWSTGWEGTDTQIDVRGDGKVYAKYHRYPPTESDEDIYGPFDSSDEPFASRLRKVWRWCGRLGW